MKASSRCCLLASLLAVSTVTVHAETGAPKPIGRYPTGKGTNWVEIVAFD